MTQDNLGKTICFDYSHNNTLAIESPSYADFTNYLFGSSFRLGKIQAGFTTLDKLTKYRMLIIGGPQEIKFEMEEIKNIVQFVKEGGSLLLIHDEGGDYEADTNLSDLTSQFGFEYENDIMFDSMNFMKLQSRILVNTFEPHPITRKVDDIVLASACSIKTNKLMEADENVRIIPLATSGFNSYHTYYNGESWVEEMDAPKSVMAVAVNYFKGKVIGIPTVSMLSSLSSSYGFFARSNQNFIISIFKWLLEDKEGRSFHYEKMINVELNYNLFSWMEDLVKQKKWGSIDDMINFSVKYCKENYEDIMQNVKELREQLKVERQKQLDSMNKQRDMAEKERETALNIFKEEDDILGLTETTIDTSSELRDIMSNLSKITNGEVGSELDFKALDKEARKRVKKYKELKGIDSAGAQSDTGKTSNAVPDIPTAGNEPINSDNVSRSPEMVKEMKEIEELDSILEDLSSTGNITDKLKKITSLSSDDPKGTKKKKSK